MKNKRKKYLTFGELVAGAYSAWGKAEAGYRMRLALKTGMVVFQGPQQSLVPVRKGELHE
jgi:hypothetical protein